MKTVEEIQKYIKDEINRLSRECVESGNTDSAGGTPDLYLKTAQVMILNEVLTFIEKKS